MTNFCIYTIHNIVNNKIYVGKTNNIKNRWSRHKANMRSKDVSVKKPIHLAMKKYGLKNFIFSVIQTFEKEEECLRAEIYWIKYFNSIDRNLGYNLTEGGTGSSGFKLSEEAKIKISQANFGLKRTNEFKITRSQNMTGSRNHFYGKTHSEKTKLKYSGENSKSSKLSANQVNDIINLFTSKAYSQKQISKIYNVSQQHISRIVNKKCRVRG